MLRMEPNRPPHIRTMAPVTTRLCGNAATNPCAPSDCQCTQVHPIYNGTQSKHVHDRIITPLQNRLCYPKDQQLWVFNGWMYVGCHVTGSNSAVAPTGLAGLPGQGKSYASGPLASMRRHSNQLELVSDIARLESPDQTVSSNIIN